MDIGGWYKLHDTQSLLAASLPRPSLSPEQRSTLAELRPRLTDIGYTEYAVRQWLDGMDLCERRFEQIPGYLWRFRRAASPAADLAGFALMRQNLALARAREIFGPCLEVLAHLRLLEVEGDQVVPRADLYPCRGAYLFADNKFSAYKRLPNHVYEVGRDSYDLARTTPRRPVGRALDLCLGSGVHAILAAGHAQAVTGVDINPRAVEFGGLNAVINGVADRCQFKRGDLFSPVAGRQFDLITSNTPFVPTPADDPLEAYRDGGLDGEDLNRRLIRGLPQHLAVGGQLSLFTNYPEMHNSDYLDRIAGWLGGAEGWGLTLLHFSKMPREIYIELQIFDWDPQADGQAYRKRFEKWVELYESQAIDAISEGTLLIRRLPDSHPGYRQTLVMPHPMHDLCEIAGDWQEALETYTHPAWRCDWQSTPRLHRQVKEVLVGLSGGTGRVDFKPEGWDHHERLSADEVALLRHLGSSAEDVAERAGLDQERAAACLADLGRRLILTV